MHTCSQINPSKERESHPVQTVDDLKYYLQVAVQLEHATIPPYLTALYSIKDDAEKSNKAAADIIRAVAVEEMLHMTLAANLLNAIGGSPRLTQPKFVPDYPTYLPTGEEDFEAGLHPFSRHTIGTFLNIERPTPIPETSESHGMVRLGTGSHQVHYLPHARLNETRHAHLANCLIPPVKQANGEDLHFWSIGEFYNAVAQGFELLDKEMGHGLFKGDLSRQVGPGIYYSGGGDIVQVEDLATAQAAIELIVEQGEANSGRIYDDQQELSHYYRFDQIVKGRYYRVSGDSPGDPQGPEFHVHWENVYPLFPNAKVRYYLEGSELRRAAEEFNAYYAQFLAFIEEAYNGSPAKLKDSFTLMFQIKAGASRLIRHPFVHNHFSGTAAPTFEIPGKQL